MSNVCLVTGAIGGIGTEICKRLYRDNNIVVATYRRKNEDVANNWQRNLKKEGIDVHIFPVDVTSFESCSELVEKVQNEIGIISVLINNAGITDDAVMKNMTVEQWQRVLNTNLNSVFNMSKLVFQGMCENGWGRIINISSINGQKGQFGQVNYAAAKAGMYGLTKSLAQEGARKGVTVNTISPGYIATEMVTSLPSQVIDKIVNEIPVRRLGKPEEVAHTVNFLISKQSDFITGSNIAVNGGQHMY